MLFRAQGRNICMQLNDSLTIKNSAMHTESSDRHDLQLKVKGCGADVTIQVQDDITAAELSSRLEADYHIAMQSNTYNVNGTRIAGTEQRPLLNEQTSNKGDFTASLIIESSPLE